MTTLLPSPLLSPSVDDFMVALRASRLLSDQQLQDLPLPQNRALADGRSWAEGLVACGLLTDYQAQQILAGQAEALMFGQYRILDRLGAGGMGQVYKAEHILMKRLVALKVIVPHLVRDQEAVARFHGEVQLAARLSHPNIVTAYDAAEANGLHFLVMEYVEGIDLGKYLKEAGPLGVPLACECVRQTALGLQHAYELGLMHCDIKPANLLLGMRNAECGMRSRLRAAVLGGSTSFRIPHFTFPILKILDFGLARLAGSSTETATVRSLTGYVSNLAGTPDYMAPEQARDCQAADIRSDLYSLGCTFYHLLTGQVPFPGGTWAEKLLRHQFDPVPAIAELRRDLPETVAGIVDRLLAKEPADRYETPAELAGALQDWLSAISGMEGSWPRATASVPTPLALDGLTLTDPNREKVATTPPPPSGGPAEQLVELNRARTCAGSRPSIPFPRRWIQHVAVVGAVAVGLLLAWIARPLAPTAKETVDIPSTRSASAEPQKLAQARQACKETKRGPVAPSNLVELASAPGSPFTCVDTAVAAARDGDTLVLRGAGPFSTPPLSLRGKSLTIRAAPGCRPRITLLRTTTEAAWHPLFTADRPLILDGLDLCGDESGRASAEAVTTHLVFSEGAALRLVDCQLLAPRGRALVVCRNAEKVEIQNCCLHADGSAVCVELGGGPNVDVHLTGNRITLLNPLGAALSLWQADGASSARAQLWLERNTVTCGRVVSLAGLVTGVKFDALGNTFVFDEALLSWAGSAEVDNFRRATHWRGRDNQYHAAHGWLSVNGASSAVTGLAAWREFWKADEAGSVEAGSSYPLESARLSPAH
jgi:serine/threonine-protein kinase